MAVGDAAQQDVPNVETIRIWATAAVEQIKPQVQLSQSEQLMTVRIVDVDEITQLNEQYRQKTGATNVLSFPFEPPPGVPENLCDNMLGDLVVCAAVVAQEAAEQHKLAEAHWAHMIVHGTLHLLGYDHLTDAEAEHMEMEEIAVLEGLGYANPYQAV